ncbi:MAG: hypothetical protein IH804_09340 [Planctomycetes bacterium]|nr:hypothetical protein [Planctomycetota bacterium]
MGRLRADNGHPGPYDIRLWEIGNEIYGPWQVRWTTPAGNADRYRRFRQAIHAVDPSIQVLGCGYGNQPDSEWNQRLIDGRPAPAEGPTIQVGGSESYEARCRKCHQVPQLDRGQTVMAMSDLGPDEVGPAR